MRCGMSFYAIARYAAICFVLRRVKILNFICTCRVSVMIIAKRRGGILKFHSPPRLKISATGSR